MPANDPSTVAMSEVPTAAAMEVFTASRIVGSVVPVRYAARPTPSQVSMERPSLNEYTTMTRIGRNRKANTRMPHTRNAMSVGSRRRFRAPADVLTPPPQGPEAA